MWVGFVAALRGLVANKLRSFLTMLGVIFGVAAVIVAVALGQGSRDASLKRFQKFGTKTLTIIPGRQNKSGVSFGTVSTLKYADAKAISRGAPSVRRISPERSGFLQAKTGNKNTNTQVYGCGSDFPKIRNFELAQGAFFTEADVRSKRFVCVLGWQAYKDLFDRGNVVGQKVYIKGQNFKIVGVFKERGSGGFQNEDDRIFVPVTSALHRLFGSDSILSTMSVEGRSEALMSKAQEEVTDILKKRHKIGTNKANDFIIFNNQVAMQNSTEQAADFEQLISWLAAVALIVGGIGIMNIMLVSVTERTREIGIRKAIGAKRWHILLQFLLEAMFLSLTGGLIGVLSGIFFTLYGLPVMKPTWETTLTTAPIMVAFGFSALVGIFFGFYPAFKASKLDPIQALRYE